MSVLVWRSVLVLALLFGMLFAVGTAVLWHFDMNIWFGLVWAVVVVGLQYLIGPYIIEWIFSISWMPPDQVRPELAGFLSESCRREGIPVPKFGVIEDGNPNAFTYGHTPGDARLVVTRGLIDMLSEDELEAVVGHELGHIKHWDFVVMTVASLVPLVLYQIYVWTRYSNRRDKDGAYALAIAIGAYIAYILSQFIVLFLSRVREYYADYHSARTTRNPNALASALVTIAYGMARTAPPQPEESDDDKKKAKRPVFDRMGSVSSLCFFGKKGVSQFAMTAADSSGNFSPENMRKAMAWDLYNPWARWFELASTHPLPAKRIMEIERQTKYVRQTPAYEFASSTVDYRGKFVVDLAMMALPYVGLFAGLGIAWLGNAGREFSFATIGGLPIMLFGAGMLLRTLFAYRGDYRPSQIISLVTDTDVSHIRPIPAEIKGKIIGRGVPGLFFSDDLVIQDENGFTTLIYRQPFGFLEFLFGWLRAGSLVGHEAVVRGWYRRGPGPYFEMKEAVLDNGDTIRCYYYQFLLGLSAVIVAAGAVLMLVLT